MARIAQGLTSAGFATVALAAEPWTPNEIIQAPELAKRIESGSAPPIICVAFPVLYRQRHIRGAKFAGPTNKPEGVKSLEALAATLAKNAEVVIYCGCCPMKDCPNIRPAYEALKQMGFKTVRVLNIPTNMHSDWMTKGYPAEPPVAPERG
ncbi:MAG: rhodanese-like domain-containing protein [Bryobacteraceae bacterium]